jgi:hypothetical protein
MILLQRPRIFDVDVLGGVALLVFGVVAWFGIITPARANRIASQDVGNAVLLADAAIQRSAENLRKTEADIQRLRDAVGEQIRRSPTQASLPHFLQRIATLAEDHGLQVAQVIPQPARLVDGRMVSDVQVTARGDVFALARLLDRLRREVPYFSVAEYSVGRNKDAGSEACVLTWTLRLHMLPGEGPTLPETP